MNNQKLHTSKNRRRKIGWNQEDDHDINVFGAVETDRFDFSHMPVSYMANWVQCLPSLELILWHPQNFGFPKALMDPTGWIVDLPPQPPLLTTKSWTPHQSGITLREWIEGSNTSILTCFAIFCGMFAPDSKSEGWNCSAVQNFCSICEERNLGPQSTSHPKGTENRSSGPMEGQQR